MLFSITKKDFRVDTFRAGGKGGQHQNKTSSAVRITHLASGAVGEARDCRHQHQNRVAAFRRCVESSTFRIWHRMRVAELTLAYSDIAAVVAGQLDVANLKVEIRRGGRWVVLD